MISSGLRATSRRGFLFCQKRRFLSSYVNGLSTRSSSAGANFVEQNAPTAIPGDGKEEVILDEGEFIRGQVLDLGADLRTFRPGDKLEIPYEITVSESMQDFWQSVRCVVELYPCFLNRSLLFSIQHECVVGKHTNRHFICKIGSTLQDPSVGKWDCKIVFCHFH